MICKRLQLMSAVLSSGSMFAEFQFDCLQKSPTAVWLKMASPRGGSCRSRNSGRRRKGKGICHAVTTDLESLWYRP